MAKQMSLGFWNTLIVKILRISRVGFVSESRGRFNRSAIRLFKDNVLGAEHPVVNLGLDYHVDIFVDYRVVWVYVRIPSARNVRANPGEALHRKIVDGVPHYGIVAFVCLRYGRVDVILVFDEPCVIHDSILVDHDVVFDAEVGEGLLYVGRGHG